MAEGKTVKRVILVTDGDEIARQAVERAARNIGGRCVSASAGNPTPLNGAMIVKLIKETPHDPVVVMFDDRGSRFKGKGEKALEYVVKHPDIEVMGVLAVASHTEYIAGAHIDVAVNNRQELVEGQVDKNGRLISSRKVILGDTVDVLNNLREKIPIVVGIGDIGKMEGSDAPEKGAQVTTKALQYIMEYWQSGRAKSLAISES